MCVGTVDQSSWYSYIACSTSTFVSNLARTLHFRFTGFVAVSPCAGWACSLWPPRVERRWRTLRWGEKSLPPSRRPLFTCWTRTRTRKSLSKRSATHSLLSPPLAPLAPSFTLLLSLPPSFPPPHTPLPPSPPSIPPSFPPSIRLSISLSIPPSLDLALLPPTSSLPTRREPFTSPLRRGICWTA